MISQNRFSVAKKALKKLHPNWMAFIDEVMGLVYPFWEGNQSREHVHFIHLIGYGKRQKAREILTDMIELLDWESDTVFLWNNWDINSPTPYNQALGLQESFNQFPKVVVTDFLSEFIAKAVYENETCEDFDRVKSFLKVRKQLDLRSGIPPLNAKGGLIISFLDSFGESDFIRTRLMFQFVLHTPAPSLTAIRSSYIPEELHPIMDKEYIKKEDLLFFSKDEPRQILLALELLKIKEVLEDAGSELLQIPVRISFGAMDYFICYTFYKKLSNAKLRQAALDFFIPVFFQYPQLTKNIQAKPSEIQLDFSGGWKFQAVND